LISHRDINQYDILGTTLQSTWFFQSDLDATLFDYCVLLYLMPIVHY